MQRLPTHSEVVRLISSLLPPKANDVSLLYHVPRTPNFDFNTTPVDHVVLSVTPSPRIYDAIGDPADRSKPGSQSPQSEGRQASQEPRAANTVCFLHRPFPLIRRRVRDDVLVLASHTSFDEYLTVGYNTALANRLGMDISDSVCVQGYKSDPQRKIGIVGRVSMILGLLLRSIEKEFGIIEHAQEGLSEEIHAVAIMNAFHAGEVHRVVEITQSQNYVPSDVEKPGSHVLYLTGQVRDSGLAAAQELGMTVVSVGHRCAEQWGIEYVAATLRRAYPSVNVKEIYEDGLLLPN